MYLVCMNKNRLQARLGCWFFFYKCVGLLSFSVMSFNSHIGTQDKKQVVSKARGTYTFFVFVFVKLLRQNSCLILNDTFLV